MNGGAWALIAVAAGFAVADWVAVDEGVKRVEYVCKPAVIVALLLAALVLDPRHEARRDWFVAALALSLVGDVFLMLPDRFVEGLGAFLLAHVAYIGGLLAGGLTAGGFLVAAVVVVAVSVAVGRRVVAGIEASGQRELVGPVIAYVVVLSAMMTCAAAARPALTGFGAALFYGSDALIAWNRFVRVLPWAPVAIMVTYHLAQMALVTSLGT